VNCSSTLGDDNTFSHLPRARLVRVMNPRGVLPRSRPPALSPQQSSSAKRMSLVNLCSRLIVTGIHKNARLSSVDLSTHESARPTRVPVSALLYRVKHASSTGTPARPKAHLPRVTTRFGAGIASCDRAHLFAEAMSQDQLHSDLIRPRGIEMGLSQEPLSPLQAPLGAHRG
jgi:hypothetical protein